MEFQTMVKYSSFLPRRTAALRSKRTASAMARVYNAPSRSRTKTGPNRFIPKWHCPGCSRPKYSAGNRMLGGDLDSRRFSKPPLSKTVLTDEISVRQDAVPRTITARPPCALRRNNYEFTLRSFCVVGSEMIGSDGL
jgi:hypothetical protein